MFELVLFQKAFLACLIIGFTNGYASAFVLMNRSPLKLSALSHSLLPGICLATFLVGLTVVSAFIGAVVTAIAIGTLSILFARYSKLSQDTMLSILYTGAFALGIMAIDRMGHASELEHWLLGNILGITHLDLTMSFIIGVLAIGLMTLFMRPILITLFEPDVAQTLGIPVRVVQYVGFTLLILVLVTTLQAVGCILSVGLIVTPGATIRLFTNRPRVLFIGSGGLGAIGAATGLTIAYHLDFPAEASIVMTLTSFFLIAWIIHISLTLYKKKLT